MFLMEGLSQTERDKLLAELDERQRMFVVDYLKRGRRTVFSNVLAKEKASFVDEDSVEEVASQWELLDYIDAGPEWQKSSDKLYCECGRHLRYQYIVQNNDTGEIKKFGIKHFEDHIGIPPHLVKDIVKGIAKIDFEMDEILLKIADRWTLAREGIEVIPSAVAIPKDIQQHFEYNVPLLERQVQRLKGRIANHLREEKRKQLESLQVKAEEEAKRQRDIVTQKKQAIAAKMGWGKKQQGNIEIPLEKDLQLGILVYLEGLKKTQFRASEVCEELVKYHGASNETYSSGTLQIFPHVCIFLESLITAGKLELVEKQGVKDRTYRIVDTTISLSGPKIDDSPTQISLFD